MAVQPSSSKKASSKYNQLCSLYRELHPECKGNVAYKKVKELYWDPYKASKCDIDEVIKTLKEKVDIKRQEKLKSKLTFFGFKKPSSSSTASSQSSKSSSTASSISAVTIAPSITTTITGNTTTTSSILLLPRRLLQQKKQTQQRHLLRRLPQPLTQLQTLPLPLQQ